MAKITIIGVDSGSWAANIFSALRRASTVGDYDFLNVRQFCQNAQKDNSVTTCVYAPSFAATDELSLLLKETQDVFLKLQQLDKLNMVLISSALLYGASPGRQAFATEDYPAAVNCGNPVCDQWNSLEQMAHEYLGDKSRLTILRPVTVLPSPTPFSKRLTSQFVFTLPGHDPTMQFLSMNDLARAIDRVIELEIAGIFNIAPDGVVPLNVAIRLMGSHRLSIPRTLQRLGRCSGVLDYLRYSWTVSNERAKMELGFAPAKSSVRTLLEIQGPRYRGRKVEIQFDDFGMDRDYIRFFGKTLLRFLCDFYWRIEHKGLEHIPREGRAVLVGMHRGFMPWDGVMALHLLVTKTDRYPRFLTHPGLLKFPFLANFMTKLGGVVASQKSADRILESDQLLGIFPEGIHGAFTSYREVYRLQGFGRDAFVKMALRNRAPIVPFVTVGSAEIFPIFGKIKSRFWTRYTDWPCIPITPTFPLLPIPLPAKWHTQFLAPIHVEKKYPPEAARDRTIVKAISLEVRSKMQQAIDEMLRLRQSIFYGSIFEPEAGQ